METPVVLIGVGELGGVFARGMLRTGHPVYPVLRGMDPVVEAVRVPRPEAVIVATGEEALPSVLSALPPVWRAAGVVLLQNELLPRDWLRHGLERPTIVAVWFEKKRGMDVKVLLPSPVWGPHAALIAKALAALDIPAIVVDTANAMLVELVAKNLYILTTNIAGLVLPQGATVGELRRRHLELERAVAAEVWAVQEWLAGQPLERTSVWSKMEAAMAADPDHKCMGRSAPKRLLRTLQHARQARIATPTLEDIARRVGLLQE